MFKNLTLAVLSAVILSSFIPVFVFDFQSLRQQVRNGEITRQEARNIVKNAVKNGEISKEEVKAHRKQMKQRRKNRNNGNYNYHRNMNNSNYNTPNYNIPNNNDRYSNQYPNY